MQKKNTHTHTHEKRQSLNHTHTQTADVEEKSFFKSRNCVAPIGMEESFQPLEEKKNKNIVKHHIEKVKKNQKIVEGCQREKDFFCEN